MSVVDFNFVETEKIIEKKVLKLCLHIILQLNYAVLVLFYRK